MEEHRNLLYPLFSNIYLNSANGFIGINASGKTSVLKVILLVLGIINNEPINHIETKDILGDAKRVKLNTYFFSSNTNENVLPVSEDIPKEVITFLDPTIEFLDFDEKDKKPLIHLKFKGKKEILLNNPVELNNYLSSGTVKGMITFTLAQEE